MERVYIDTNIFIGAFEGQDDTSLAIRNMLSDFEPYQNTLVTSEITLAEIGARDRFGHRFAAGLGILGVFIDLMPVTRDLLLETCDYRILMKETGRNVRLPDAIHCVTALRRNCRFVLTADKRFHLPPQIDASARMRRDSRSCMIS